MSTYLPGLVVKALTRPGGERADSNSNLLRLTFLSEGKKAGLA